MRELFLDLLFKEKERFVTARQETTASCGDVFSYHHFDHASFEFRYWDRYPFIGSTGLPEEGRPGFEGDGKVRCGALPFCEGVERKTHILVWVTLSRPLYKASISNVTFRCFLSSSQCPSTTFQSLGHDEMPLFYLEWDKESSVVCSLDGQGQTGPVSSPVMCESESGPVESSRKRRRRPVVLGGPQVPKHCGIPGSPNHWS